MSRFILVAIIASLLVSACTSDTNGPSINGQDVHITLLHTTDIHSRLVPYDLQVGEIDARLGLAQELEPFGGAARMAYIVERERSRAGRSVVIDTGDVSQGAPIYNFFSGEPEMRFLNTMGIDLMVMGNHEFDLGGVNLFNQLYGWSQFPVLASNYLWEDPDRSANSRLGEVSTPYVLVNAEGLRVGVIGLANLSSMNSIYDSSNRLGITPLDMVTSCQYFVDMVKPLVDLVVVVSHLGLRADEELIEAVSDIDVVLGGHHHVVLNPPKVIEDPIGRHVPMAHSGAFAKYVGRFDLVVRQCDRIPECTARYRAQEGREPPSNDWEVVSSQYVVFPVDSTTPQDELMADHLEDYVDDMNESIDLNQLIGYAPNMVRRFGATGGDSQLGNLVATSMRLRQGVQTDFALSNTLGIRADFVPGPVSVEQMFNVFPFENTITTLQLSAPELQEMFDFITQRSSERGCATQAQIAGSAVVMNCGDVCPPEHLTGSGCNIEPEPAVQRVLIGEATVEPSRACREVLASFQACCDDVVRCGCIDADCLESECEQRARSASPGCEETFEPYYSTDPCSDDAECIGRDETGLQRCFIPQGQTYGSCFWGVVDDYQIIDPNGSYSLAANDYIARGGSGFRVLGRNTTQNNLGISLRDAAMDYIRAGPPCTDNAACSTDDECPDGQLCACDAMSQWDDDSGACSWDARENFSTAPVCANASGHCILAACADDVTEYRAERVRPCDDAPDEAARDRCLCNHRRWALNECQELSCINARLGALSDGRQQMVQP